MSIADPDRPPTEQQQQDEAPRPPPEKPAVFAFMMTAAKKLQVDQAESKVKKAAQANPPAAATTTTITTTASNDGDPPAGPDAKSKTKRPRKPRKEGSGKRAKKPKQQTTESEVEEPEPELPPARPAVASLLQDAPPSSSAPFLESFRTDIDPVTAAAPLPQTIASSPPPPPPPQEKPTLPGPMDLTPVAEAEIDLNHERRKRRKPTPPDMARVRIECSPGGTVLDTPERRLRRRTSQINYSDAAPTEEEVDDSASPVSYTRTGKKGILKIRAQGGIRPHDLLPSSSAPPSSPLTRSVMFPPSSPPPNMSSPRPVSSGSGIERPRTSFDKDSGVFTIRSSPPLVAVESAPKRNLFTELGKKRAPPPPKEVKEKPAKKERKPRGKKGKAGQDENQGAPEVINLEAIDPLEEMVQNDTTVVSVPTESVAAPVVVRAAVEPEKPKGPPKTAHPFFSAIGRKKMVKVAPVDPVSPDATAAEGAAADSKPRSGLTRSTSNLSLGHSKKPSFGSSFGRSFRSLPKAPGMLEAPWPLPGTSHVRGEGERGVHHIEHGIPLNRKLKESVVVATDESVLAKLGRDLDIVGLKQKMKSPDYYEHEFRDIPPEVRLPERIVTTGSELQDMVRTRVSARLPHPKAAIQSTPESDSDSVSEMVMTKSQIHPSLLRLYRRLREELTPFDMHRRETTPWEVKYAPACSVEVLQPSKETEILAQWLEGLRTDKLDKPTGKRKAADSTAKAKKKRKKKDDMDGFIVSSQEEQNEMSEITDPEDDDWLNPNPKTKKSSIRVGDKSTEADAVFGRNQDSRKTNTVVISGPVGCGKTAAVYAVAKEQGYTVFEVTAGNKRNGKDVLDQVGDMSRNHLVHQAKDPSDNPFAIAKAAAKQMVREESPQVRQQTQSLILLEEVDILFEEDRTFWASVLTLMSKSRRPIVMTCNDESLIPLDTFNVHAILRFSAPPEDLALDHLLLIMANEGHLLERNAVRSLWQINRNDIRSTLMDLQLYCRFGVGDRTGGMNWQIDRYPPGCDIAPNGEVQRVVSIDTYHEGMGWFEHSPDAKEEDKWADVWEEFGLDIGGSTRGLCERPDGAPHRVGKRLKPDVVCNFFDARSAADAFSCHVMRSIDQPKLDYTQPPSAGTPDTLLGYNILSTPTHAIPGSIAQPLLLTSLLLARRYISHTTHSPPITPQQSNAELTRAIITHHTTPAPLMQKHLQDLFHPISQQVPLHAASTTTVHSCAFPSVRPLAEEVAGYVRGIVRKDVSEEVARRRGMGGKGRSTRAAMLAGEGVGRGKERWLRGVGAGVLKSAGQEWEQAAEERMQEAEGRGEDGEEGSSESDTSGGDGSDSGSRSDSVSGSDSGGGSDAPGGMEIDASND